MIDLLSVHIETPISTEKVLHSQCSYDTPSYSTLCVLLLHSGGSAENHSHHNIADFTQTGKFHTAKAAITHFLVPKQD